MQSDTSISSDMMKAGQTKEIQWLVDYKDATPTDKPFEMTTLEFRTVKLLIVLPSSPAVIP